MFDHKGTQTMETQRLILRKATRKDGEAMFRNWASDPDVTKYLTWPTHDNVEVSQWVVDSWIQGYEKDDFYQWMIVPKDLGEPIGTISVVAKHVDAGELELGYCIGKNWWHRGIMSETLEAVIDYLFAEVGARRITARHDMNNPNSGAVMKKCGMHCEGIVPAGDRNNQGICDVARYAILRSDWK